MVFIGVVLQGMKLLIIIVCKLSVWLYLLLLCVMTEKMKSDMKTLMQQNFFNLTSFNLEIPII